MFITEAFAQTSTPPAANMFDILFPMVLIFIVVWFFMIRPQHKKMQEHQDMVDAVRKGDTVITSGGFVGKVTKVFDEKEVEVEIADNVKVRLMRTAISDVKTKGNPV